MPFIELVLKYLLISLTVAAIVYYLVSVVSAARFFSGRNRSAARSDLLPVSVMIPLQGADFGAYENYSRFCSQDYPEYQIVFGVRDSEDSSVPLIRRLTEAYPDRDIELVINPEVTGQNLKVSNLQNMLARVKHDRIVIVDSDIRVGRDYLRNIVPLLHEKRVGLVTCLYRAAGAPTWASRIEAIGLTADFGASVIVARMVEGIRFALGSTMAMTRTTLNEIGGFRAIVDYLADDFMLGYLISGKGYEVRLAPYPVETVMEPIGFREMIKHQVRWARSTRMSRPLGYSGMIVTYGTPLSLLYCLMDGGSLPSLLLAAVTFAARFCQAWLVGVVWLEDAILKKYLWLLPVRDIFSFLIWGISLVGRKVEWRGRRLEILSGGKIMDSSRPAGRPEFLIGEEAGVRSRRWSGGRGLTGIK